MGKVHRDVAVPIPAGAVTYRNGLVFDPLHGDKELMLIGYACSDTEMNPNQNYFQFHREEWLQFNPEGAARVRPDTLETGLYAALLGAAQKTGILDSLYEAFSFPDANALLDCGMAAMRGESPEALGDSVTFHGPVLAEAWYADFFAQPDTAAKARTVLEQWVRRCADHGCTGVYLGTCDTPVPNAVWAIAADGAAAGLPLMCFPQAGKAIWTAVQWFAAYKLQVRGILWSEKGCRQEGPLPWAQVLDRDGGAFAGLHRQYGPAVREEIRCRLESGLFGALGSVEEEGISQRAVLLYRPVAGAMAGTKLLDQVQEAADILKAKIAAGETPVIPEALAPYLAIHGTSVEIQTEPLQRAYLRQGYIGLAVSRDMEPREAAVLLQAKEAAEMAMAGVPSEAASGLQAAWILGVLQAVVCAVCAHHGLSWQEAVPALRRVQYHLGGRTYRCGEELPEPAASVLQDLDITLEMLQDFAQEVSRRYLQGSGPLSRVYRNRLPWKLAAAAQGEETNPSGQALQVPDAPAGETKEKGRTRGGRPKGKKDSYQRVRSTREQMEKRRKNNPPEGTQ